jgi:hypothetical protein
MPIKLIEKTLIYVAERKSFVNEGELRDALCKNLNDQYHTTGWWWGVEEKFKTDCLENIQEIKFDIIGIRQSNGESEAFLIELKYVPVNIETGRPNDTPAFAYDLFKNCVKIELAMGGRATGKNQFSKISGITLGITNYSKYWNKNGNFDNWATNFLNAINPLANKDIILHGVINTIAKNSEFTTIYDQERCHISLGLRWKSEWIDLKGSHEGYRFLIIKPINNDFDYQHSKLNSDTIPFLDLNAKNKYQQIIKNGRSEFIQNYSERFIEVAIFNQNV